MLKYLKLVKHKLYWSLRSLFWGYPLFKHSKDWQMPDCVWELAHLRRIIKSWEFLRPFFASHGYILYRQRDPKYMELFALPFPKPAEPETLQYPYGRRFYDTDEEANFSFLSMYCWAARDTLGRDVIIKLISDTGSIPSKELEILKYLNSDGVISDSGNHTIHVVEFLTFKGLIFVVMPRWDPAFIAAFDNVEQIMDCGLAFLEGLAFLHEHRICHGDILEQNCGINYVAEPYDLIPRTGRRDTATTRYVFYDFGASLVLPSNISLADAEVDNYGGWIDDGFPPTWGESYNPFPVDVLKLAKVLQTSLRHIENLVPQLGPFFDRMTEVDIPKRPTAQQALAEFRGIRDCLTSDQLAQRVLSHRWTKDRITYIEELVNNPFC